jgi:hypothetical protein
MAYTINLTDGSIFATIADGTINTSSSMVLVGKNYAGYGEFLDENFVHLLENSANTTAPGAPLTGQLWWDKSTATLKVYNGTLFKSISGARSSATAPTSNATGDLWWDTTNAQLKVYNGSGFTTIGPAFTAGTGTTGAIVDTVTDTLAADHVVIKMFVNNTIVGIWSKDAEFTPAASLSGFATIKPGLNMSTASAYLFQGTATNATTLGNVAASGYMVTSGATTNDTSISIQNDTGLYVGGDSDGRLYVSGTDVYLGNQTLDGDIRIRVNDGGSQSTAILVDGAESTIGVKGITNLLSDGVGNIGASGRAFNTIFAKATSAQYADLAERFETDQTYPAGTVVELGGEKEVTIAKEELTDSVFGVISTQAAFMMNGMAGDDLTHPAIAMTGRVPVLVTGVIKKGDRLVSAGNGYARAADASEVTAFNVIGRALEDKNSDGYGTVEAIVKVN